MNESPCRILCCGSLAASYRCLRHLLATLPPTVSVVGIVPHCNGALGRADQDVRQLAAEHEIPLLTMAQLEALEFDLGISFLFDAKIPAPLVARPCRGFLNLHLGPLPRFRGSNSVLHAIRLARQDGVWRFGISLMYMQEQLDTGPLIEVMDVPLYEDDTAGSLHARAIEAVPVLFAKYLPAILSTPGKIPSIAQSGDSYFFRRAAVDHEIDMSWDPDRIYDTVRALSFPGKPRPFIRVGKRKIYLTLEECL